MTDLVVGGGVAGLVTAWELIRAGGAVVLVEAERTLGGAVGRHHVAGLDLDSGAESFSVAGGTVAGLLADLGLAGSICDPDPRGAWVRHRKGSAPLPAGGLLGIPGDPGSPEVRRVIGALGSLRARADRLLPVALGRSSLALGGLVRTRMGRRVVERLVEPVVGGVYSTDPEQLELVTAAPQLAQAIAGGARLTDAVRQLRPGTRPGSAVQGLTGGMYRLVEALAAAIRAGGGEILTGQRVQALTVTRSGVRVQTGQVELVGDRVVLAVPAGAAERLLGQLVPALPTSDVLLATLVVQHPGLDRAPRGTGVLVSAQAPGVTAKALTHATAKWAWLAERAGPGRHVLRLSYGRGGRPLPDPGGLPELARADAEALLGLEIRREQVVGQAVVRWSSTLPRPAVGHAAAVQRLLGSLPPRVSMVGGAVAGTGLAAVVRQARSTAATLGAVSAN